MSPPELISRGTHPGRKVVPRKPLFSLHTHTPSRAESVWLRLTPTGCAVRVLRRSARVGVTEDSRHFWVTGLLTQPTCHLGPAPTLLTRCHVDTSSPPSCGPRTSLIGYSATTHPFAPRKRLGCGPCQTGGHTCCAPLAAASKGGHTFRSRKALRRWYCTRCSTRGNASSSSSRPSRTRRTRAPTA